MLQMRKVKSCRLVFLSRFDHFFFDVEMCTEAVRQRFVSISDSLLVYLGLPTVPVASCGGL